VAKTGIFWLKTGKNWHKLRISGHFLAKIDGFGEKGRDFKGKRSNFFKKSINF